MGGGRLSCRLRARVSTVNPHGSRQQHNQCGESAFKSHSGPIGQYLPLIVISIQKPFTKEKVPEIWRFRIFAALGSNAAARTGTKTTENWLNIRRADAGH
jgi:hypothetical protein